jgi:hypothetical protein
VAENIADTYMDFKNSKYNASSFGILNMAFNAIRAIVNMLANWSNRQLYWVIAKTELGFYRDGGKKVSQEQKDRFNTLFKALKYEVRG